MGDNRVTSYADMNFQNFSPGIIYTKWISSLLICMTLDMNMDMKLHGSYSLRKYTITLY